MAVSAGESEGKRSLPGWTLARDAPRPKAKQGWECPAPTVADWEDYKKWKDDQERKEELPAATQMYLADSSLLFHKDPTVELPWVHRLRCELPHRVGRLSGELPVKASYIGFATDRADEFYELFKEAMAEIGIVLCRQVHNPPSRFEIAHLEQSDLILLAGGDRKVLWRTLGTDLGGNEVAEHVKWRYLQGALVIAVGEAMSLLGERSWYLQSGTGSVIPFAGWKIFPHILAPEAEGTDLEDLVTQLGGAGVVILAVSPGGGLIFNRDGLVEPARRIVQEYRWDWKSESVKQALLIGPPRTTGLICPLYAATRREVGDADGEGNGIDAFSYALTEDEEAEEAHLCDELDPHSHWLTSAARAEIDALKQQGNEAFKAGNAGLAGLKYEQARVLLESSRSRWSELEALSEDRKEESRADTLLIPILLNLSASHLLANSQDDEARRAAAAADAAPAPVVSNGSDEPTVQPSTLVEIRDNLVVAFRAANDALRLSGGSSAKAWYRRGCVFESMRDPCNAARDFDEGLFRAPGDKSIARKRDAARDAARQVAESMYYARHKELDVQEQRLELSARRSLCLRGSFTDAWVDDRKQFALGQPLARCVEGGEDAVEESDGRLRLVLPEPPEPGIDAPYLHVHALWTWEFLVQRSPELLYLNVEDVDLASGPLEWLCKGLRLHSKVRVLRLLGVHLGPAGAKMIGNVLAQNTSLAELSVDACAIYDAGLRELAEGLQENSGPLEVLSLQRNGITHRRLSSLMAALCARERGGGGLSELDLSGNPLGAPGAIEMSHIIASEEHKLRVIKLEDCLLDVAAFWRLTGNLSDSRPLSTLDLRCNPIGRGTRRCWHGTMGPSIRCEVLLSDHPLKVWKERRKAWEETSRTSYPLPRHWA